MLPKARPREKRRFGWPFSRRRNRRVRLTGGRGPAPVAVGGLARGVVGTLRRRGRLGLLLLLATLAAGAGVGAHRYLTRASHFAVRALRITPTRHVSGESLEARAGVALGTNLFRVDLEEIARDVAQEPWILSAHARRELPSTLVVDVVEREAACVVALGPLYLADARGVVFKRASPEEAASLPVVTGIERDRYLAEPEQSRAAVREALSLVDAWRSSPARPPIGEVHHDRLGLTLYSATGGVGVRVGRLGAGDDSVAARLRRFDAVWAALKTSGERARLIYLDNRARPDRVTVKLAAGHAPPT